MPKKLCLNFLAVIYTRMEFFQIFSALLSPCPPQEDAESSGVLLSLPFSRLDKLRVLAHSSQELKFLQDL